MSDVPSDIFREILLRLPAESLFRFRSVCKAWSRIIDDPSFIKSHTNNQQCSATLLISGFKGGRHYSFSLDSINFVDGRQTIDVTPVDPLIRRDVPCLYDYLLCNGLIFLYPSPTRMNENGAIWNPLTREVHKLPQLSTDIRLLFNSRYYSNGFWSCGFGYDYTADDYKVVRIEEWCYQRIVVYKTLVYSLKLGSWRIIKDCPCDFQWSHRGVSVNGALYWISKDGIIVLDLGTEDYSLLPWPPMPTRPRFEHLAALDGCLVLSCSPHEGCLEAWMMRDYGLQKSWMKFFSIEDLDIADITLGPVAYLKSKRQVLLPYPGGLIWLDLENNSVKEVTIHGFHRMLTSQFSRGSLFRLDDSGSVADGRKAGLKRTGADTRLKFCARNVGVRRCSDDSCSDSD